MSVHGANDYGSITGNVVIPQAGVPNTTVNITDVNKGFTQTVTAMTKEDLYLRGPAGHVHYRYPS